MTWISGQITGRPGQLPIPALRRGGWVVVAAVMALLLGAVTARAADLFVTETQAGPGDTVRFSISGTAAGDGYVVTVDSKEVASGNDADGGGVSDTFKMPDLGNSSRTVLVEANVTGSGVSSRTIEYVAPGSSTGSGTTGKQPELAFQPTPVASPPPQTQTQTQTQTKKKSTPKPAPSNPSTQRTPSRKHTKQSPPAAQVQDPAPSHSQSRSTPSHVRATPAKVRPSASNRSIAGARRASPAAGLGSTGKPTSGGAPPTTTASPAAAISGSADITRGGLPTGLIALLALLALAGVAAAAFWASRNWRPVPRGRAADEARLTALSRAASASAEWQRTIAQRRASRAGRTN